jgi:manganese efflux pump family protein
MLFFLEICGIGLLLSADSFSAAVAMGMRPFSQKDAIKFAASSGGAEAMVALIGALLGTHVVSRFAAIDHWIAFILLSGISLHMGYEGCQELFGNNKSDVSNEQKLVFHSFSKILLVSFATSLDAFGVGISLGVANKPILPFILSIGIWAFISTIAGLHLARKLSTKFGPVVSLFGALILGAMAFQMLKI